MCGVTVAPPEPPSPRPRRIATPSWLDVRLVLGVLLVLASVLVGARVVANARHTYPVVTATHPLAAGTVLSSDDVRLAQVQLPGRGRGIYLSDVHAAVGKRLGRAVGAGELLPAAALAVPEPATTLTVPLPPGAAPELRKGQRVELWISTKTCTSQVLLRDVTVQAVRRDDGGAFGSDGTGQDIVIRVDPALADRVVQALALDGAQLRAGVLAGSRQASSATLPDLTSCAPATPAP